MISFPFRTVPTSCPLMLIRYSRNAPENAAFRRMVNRTVSIVKLPSQNNRQASFLIEKNPTRFHQKSHGILTGTCQGASSSRHRVSRLKHCEKLETVTANQYLSYNHDLSEYSLFYSFARALKCVHSLPIHFSKCSPHHAFVFL